VIEGYNVVKAIEACGSSSGSTSHDVMIRDCGEGRGPAQPATASAQASGALLKDHRSHASNVHRSYS
jgi:peptidyl-prolyl isomerase F (cyclophilin D)